MRLCGSSPAVGSSRKRIDGLCITARATMSRWAMPPDRASTGALARSLRRNCSSSWSERGPGLLGRHAEEAAVEVEVVPHRQRAVERVRLGHHADEALGQRRVGHHVDAADEGPPAGGDHPGGEHAGGRGLAGAVRAEQAEDLAPAHREVERVDRLDVARVDLGELLGADHLVVGGGAGRPGGSVPAVDWSCDIRFVRWVGPGWGGGWGACWSWWRCGSAAVRARSGAPAPRAR